ncbi:MAG: dTDP-4-dehydrorhamnose reductase [Candidatus Aegiribacteria sp.]|nr:dTDP-4-dehydrorhamnose reductase [Candidatus Aegiribacteria sp.]
MKVTVLGAGGMLGSDLIPVWRESSDLDFYTHSQCDAANREQVRTVLEKNRPDLVLHLAAATDVDRCQTDRKYAYLNNTISSTIVAQECNRIEAGIVYISSIAVFDGEKTEPYTEFDMTVPVNIYGESKLQGEREIAQFCPQHWIFRTGWLFGGGPLDRKFVANILRKARQEELRVVRDCVGSPTYTVDLARGMREIVGNQPFGVYHVVNAGPLVSRYELARHILGIAHFDPDRITPCLSGDLDLSAPRPRMEGARSMKLPLLENPPVLPDWRESLEGYIEERLNQFLSS